MKNKLHKGQIVILRRRQTGKLSEARICGITKRVVSVRIAPYNSNIYASVDAKKLTGGAYAIEFTLNIKIGKTVGTKLMRINHSSSQSPRDGSKCTPRRFNSSAKS
jgi:hypothetical protein